MQFYNYIIAHKCSTLLIAIDNINTVCAIFFLSVVNWVCYGNKLECSSYMSITGIIP